VEAAGAGPVTAGTAGGSSAGPGLARAAAGWGVTGWVWAAASLPWRALGLARAFLAAYGWALVATAVVVHLTSTRVVPKLGARRRELEAVSFEEEARARHAEARRRVALETQARMDVEAAAKKERDEAKRREEALARAASYEERGSVRPPRSQGRRTSEGPALNTFSPLMNGAGSGGRGGGGGGGGYRPSGPRRPTPPGGGG